MRQSRVWMVIGGLGVLTFALSSAVVLALPESIAQWSGLGMLLWVVAGGALSARLGASLGWDDFWPLCLRTASVFGWTALLFCSLRWRLMLFQPTGNMFTILFPITFPPAAWSMMSGGRSAPANTPQRLLLAIALVASAHLVYFFGSTSVATKLFLVSLATISFAASKFPVRKHSAGGGASSLTSAASDASGE